MHHETGLGWPIRRTSSHWATKRAVASSKTRARLIFLLKAKSKPSSRAVGVSESGLLVSAGEQAILAALELVGDERGEQVGPCHLLGLGLEQSRFEDIGHAGEA